MRKITNKMLMDGIINMKARSLGRITIPDKESAFVLKERINAHVNNLTNDGYTILDHKLSTEKVEAIVNYSEQIKCYDSYRSDSEPIDHRNAPLETHVANYGREDLIKFKPILDIANDSGLLQIVQEFLGAKPTISNINMWWSFGGRKQAEHAQLFHRDLDDWRFCKLFIYLTDVDEESGPHVYVRKTSKSPLFRKIRRYSDAEIVSTFGKENVIRFVKPKGATFLVDTYGFHKGLLPNSKNRLLLQIQYSLHPIGIENYVPIEMKDNPYNSYINRLIVKT
ncbi:MAG: hypothetical protein ABL895_10585 [Cyclobacteriaceae bacterium]